MPIHKTGPLICGHAQSSDLAALFYPISNQFVVRQQSCPNSDKLRLSVLKFYQQIKWQILMQDQKNISLSPQLVKFKSTSLTRFLNNPTNFLLAQQKLLAIKIALESTETIISLCNEDSNYVFAVLLSIQQFIVHPVINYLWYPQSGQEFSCGC